MERGLFHNPIVFKDAPQDIQNQLLEWQMQPPKWAKQLYVTPETYALDGGWELTPDGEKRDLINHLCYAIRQAEQLNDDLNEVHHARFLRISPKLLLLNFSDKYINF